MIHSQLFDAPHPGLIRGAGGECTGAPLETELGRGRVLLMGTLKRSRRGFRGFSNRGDRDPCAGREGLATCESRHDGGSFDHGFYQIGLVAPLSKLLLVEEVNAEDAVLVAI